jgi:hypothetical protein
VLGLLGDDGVSKGSKAVHPVGNPMSTSTHPGFNCPGRLVGSLGTARPSRKFVGAFGLGLLASFQSRLVAVGHILVASTSVFPEWWPVVFRFAVQFAEPRESPTVAVGQAKDEDSLPSVRRADFRRRVQSERTAETAACQVSKDAIEAEREMASDVFEEDSERSKSPDVLEDDRPQMARVVFSQSLSRFAERLARVAAGDPVHLRELVDG